MNQTLNAILAISPFVTLLAACVIRAVASLQPETAWSGDRRRVLFYISFVLTAISIFGMIYMMFTVGALGGVGFLMVIFLTIFQTDAEVRIAGARSRARQVEFVWLLALAAKSKRPLAGEIEFYARGLSGRKHRQLMDMAKRLQDGMPLTELAVPQGLMPQSAEMQIHAGVTAELLQESLGDAAKRVTRELVEDQDTEDATGLLMYPFFVVPVAFLIVGFLMYYIIPKFKRIFDDFGQELPGLTIALINTSDAVYSYWYIFGLPIFYIPLSMFVLAVMAAYSGWRIVLKRIFGRWFVRWYTPDVMRALAYPLSRGIPLDRALLPIAQHPGPLRLRERLAWAIDKIQSGIPNWQALQSAGLIQHNERIVLESAERSGNLPWALNVVATNLERRSLFRILATFEVVRPIMLLILSLFVAFIAVGMFLPLVKLLHELS